jgi:hypothetical protein
MYPAHLRPFTAKERAEVDWREQQARETVFSSYVIEIAERHFQAAGEVFKKVEPSSWFHFTIFFPHSVVPHCDRLLEPKFLAMARALLAEVYDFLLFAYEGEEGLALPLSHWLRNFGSCIGQPGSTLTRLLPAKAAPALAAADEILTREHEEEMWRQGQMGY